MLYFSHNESSGIFVLVTHSINHTKFVPDKIIRYDKVYLYNILNVKKKLNMKQVFLNENIIMWGKI